MTAKLSKFHRLIAFLKIFSTKIRVAHKKNLRCEIEDLKNSSGIHATTFALTCKFLYKSVAFFFERSLELAHQAL